MAPVNRSCKLVSISFSNSCLGRLSGINYFKQIAKSPPHTHTFRTQNLRVIHPLTLLHLPEGLFYFIYEIFDVFWKIGHLGKRIAQLFDLPNDSIAPGNKWLRP